MFCNFCGVDCFSLAKFYFSFWGNMWPKNNEAEKQTAKKAANLMDVEELIKGYFHYQSLHRHCWLQMETEPKAKIDCNLRLTLIFNTKP